MEEALTHLQRGIESKRLVIRAPRMEDAPQLYRAKLETHEELRRWFPWAQSLPTRQKAEEEITHARQEFADRDDFRLHLFLKKSGALVGSSGLHRPRWEVPAFEVGYWIHTAHTANGYATEAARSIAAFAIEELGARRVEIRCEARNTASARVAGKAGFTFEGRLRNNEPGTDGSLGDTMVFSLIPGEEQK